MAELTAHEVRRFMDCKHNTRNVSVIDYPGQSTFTDFLRKFAGGDSFMTGSISFCYEMTDSSLKSFEGERNGNVYQMDLIDAPIDSSFEEITAALRITDGALVVVDCVKGVCGQIETVLRKALSEKIKPVLCLNQMMHRCCSLQADGEVAYQAFSKVIENANAIIATYDPLLGGVYPEKGTVAFSAGGLHGWAFTLTDFAKIYASAFRVEESKMMKLLWGDNFFDIKTMKWTTYNTGSPTCKRGFVKFCYEPIKQLIKICMNDQKDKLWTTLSTLGVEMKSNEKDLMGEALMKRVMQTWLPVGTTLIEMMICHLPSPAIAQKYRVDYLYEGPQDDRYANAIRNCDPNGPLMLYVSKVGIPPAPCDKKGRLFAFGRIFSGKVLPGLKFRIMGPNFVPGEKTDLHYTKILRTTAISMGGMKQETIEDMPCGSTVTMVCLDRFITNNATLTNEEEVDAHPILRSI